MFEIWLVQYNSIKKIVLHLLSIYVFLKKCDNFQMMAQICVENVIISLKFANEKTIHDATEFPFFIDNYTQ